MVFFRFVPLLLSLLALQALGGQPLGLQGSARAQRNHAPRRILWVPFAQASAPSDTEMVDALAANPDVSTVVRCLGTLEQLHEKHCGGGGSLACLGRIGAESRADVVIVRRVEGDRITLVALDRSDQTLRRTHLPAPMGAGDPRSSDRDSSNLSERTLASFGPVSSWLVTGRVSLPEDDLRYPAEAVEAVALLDLGRFRRYVTRDGLSLLDLLREAGRPIELIEDTFDVAAAPRNGGPFFSVRASLD